MALTLCTVYVPGIHEIFSLEVLSGNHLLIAIGLAAAIIPIAEIIKVVYSFIKPQAKIQNPQISLTKN
jgi:hypothetical protein